MISNMHIRLENAMTESSFHVSFHLLQERLILDAILRSISALTIVTESLSLEA